MRSASRQRVLHVDEPLKRRLEQSIRLLRRGLLRLHGNLVQGIIPA
jgi:hypothetical protein